VEREVTRNAGSWVIVYGAFLILMGIAGYLSNPERAATALVSGGTFGALSIVWGSLMRRRIAWARWAATVTIAFLTLVFAWRATVSWLAVRAGQPGKLVAAELITAMGVASVLMLIALLRDASRSPRRNPSTAPPPPP
jgi:uncharacterized membrane protein (UPF0136 family)